MAARLLPVRHIGKSMTGRWHIMDCGLQSDVGHHLFQASAIAAELRKRGIPTRFFINHLGSPEIIPGFEVKPLFRATVYETVSNDTICGEYEDFISLNRMMAEDLARIGVKSFTRDDIVVFPATIHNQLLGILQWAETLDPESLPRIVVVLMFPPYYTPAPWRRSTPAMYYRYAWKSCPDRVRERLYLCTDNEDTAREYESILGFRPTGLPPPITGWEMASVATGKRLVGQGSDELLISYLGHGRHEKGFHLLPDAIRPSAVSRLPVRFFVQAYELVEPGLAEVADRLASESRVQLHRGAMERDAYYSVLAVSDLTLLPYDSACYRARGSMVYFEASVMGTPVIVPAGTWLEREVIEHGNGVAFSSFTPEAVAQAIADALPRVKTLRANAQRHATQLRPNRGIDAYVDCVLRLGSGTSQNSGHRASVTTSAPVTTLKRLFIIQHGLSDLHAHYYGETLGWLAACRDRGISPRFYIKRGALPQIVLKLAAKPVFPYAPDESIDPDSISWQLSDYMTLSTGFADACKTLEADGVGGNDLVVVPFASERCVLGAAQWLQRLSPAARPAMAFNFLVPDLNWRIEDDRSRVSGEFSYFRYAARCIRELLPPSKLFFTSPVYGLCTALSDAAQYRCREVPLGTSFPREKELATLDRDMPPRAHIGVLGEFRPERGSEMVGEVLLRFAALRPGKSIAVHVMNEGQATALRKTAREKGVRSPFFLYHGHTDHALFLRRLLSTDILLLPYNWKRYALRPSNVFSEAAGYGIVAVVPDRTWAADKLLEGHGAGTIFRDFSVDSMTEALVTASEQCRELKELAVAKKLPWRQAHSTRALLDNILANRPAD